MSTNRAALKIDREIDAAWNRLARGVQVNMMDIPSIFDECRTAIVEGKQAVDVAVKLAIAKYRLN